MPPKNRRRALIVTLLIFAIATAVWLLTPGIDPRLVGEWHNVDPVGFAAWREFDADGTHRYSTTAGSPNPPYIAYWSTSGKTLTFRQPEPPLLTGGSIRRWIYSIVNRYRQGPGIEHYKILEVTPETLRIQSDSGAPIEEYRRKP
jgi:hypothetical protein